MKLLTLKITEDEITVGKFTARLNDHTMKFSKMNLPHDEITTMILPAMKLPQLYVYGLSLDENTKYEITDDEITDVENNR